MNNVNEAPTPQELADGVRRNLSLIEDLGLRMDDLASRLEALEDNTHVNRHIEALHKSVALTQQRLDALEEPERNRTFDYHQGWCDGEKFRREAP